MKQQVKKKILLGFIAICLILTGFAVLTLNIHNKNSAVKAEINDVILERPKSSTTVYYDFNITIDNEDPTCDWTWAEGEAWCSGDGSWTTPYLIDDIEIYLNNTDTACINISNSYGVYFKISNVILTNNASDYGVGISLLNSTNGIIDTAISDSNGDYGIHVEDCLNITLVDAHCSGNHHGGAVFLNTNSSSVISCNFSANNMYGLIFQSGCIDNIIDSDCYFNDNGMIGILLQNVINCNLTETGDKQIYRNGIGLCLNEAIECIIQNGDFINNTNYGLQIAESGEASENNMIYENSFEGNGINGEDNATIGVGNLWDNNIASGNYWADYTGADLDDDGIGDDPYDISGSAGRQDNFPIWDDGDSIAPAITITSPTSGFTSVSPPSFSLTIIEAVGISTRWYTLDNGIVNITFTGVTGSINFNEWDAITGDPETTKTVSIIFYANDTSENEGSASISVRKVFPPLPPEKEEKEEEAPPYFIEQVYVCVSLIGLFAIFKLKKYLKKLT